MTIKSIVVAIDALMRGTGLTQVAAHVEIVAMAALGQENPEGGALSPEPAGCPQNHGPRHVGGRDFESGRDHQS